MPLVEETIDEQMLADWKTISEKHLSEDEPVAPAEAAPEAKAKAAPVEPEAKSDKPRDESGRFAKAEAAPAQAETEQQAQASAEQQTVADRDINRAPSSWKPAAKAAWDQIPADIRAEIQRRESDFLAGQSQLIPDAQLGKTLRNVIAPYQPMIAAEGGTPEGAVNELFRTASALRFGSMETRIGTLRNIATRYGVPLEALAPVQQQGEGAQQVYRDPRLDQFLAEQQRQDQERQAREQAQAQAQSQQLTQFADTWMREADTQGKPLRPFVENVQSEMLALIPRVREQNPNLSYADVLQQAYERAVLANPETAKIVMEQKLAALEAQRKAENQRRVDEAKKASSVNVPRRASVPSPAKPGSMEETIREGLRASPFFNH